jgi:hypothetical protein
MPASSSSISTPQLRADELLVSVGKASCQGAVGSPVTVASLPARGRPPQAAARRAGPEVVEKSLPSTRRPGTAERNVGMPLASWPRPPIAARARDRTGIQQRRQQRCLVALPGRYQDHQRPASTLHAQVQLGAHPAAAASKCLIWRIPAPLSGPPPTAGGGRRRHADGHAPHCRRRSGPASPTPRRHPPAGGPRRAADRRRPGGASGRSG